jgi:hypothetical protein
MLALQSDHRCKVTSYMVNYGCLNKMITLKVKYETGCKLIKKTGIHY